jgi:hypothetical protein
MFNLSGNEVICWSKNGSQGGSKMATRVQKQTAWALWIKNHAEMLEPHLVEIKHQGESKLGHPEPLARRKLIHATLHWKIRGAPTAANAGSKRAWETFSRPIGKHQALCDIPPVTPGINHHSLLGRLTPPNPHKKNPEKEGVARS